MQLVGLLHGFATGSGVDEEQALSASGGLRVNIMREGATFPPTVSAITVTRFISATALLKRPPSC